MSGAILGGGAPGGAARPAVAAVDMGYGHLRAARPIAEALGVEVLQVDRAPLADAEELRLWRRVRRAYEWTSRASQVPGLGAPLRRALEWVTDIPHRYPLRDLSAPTRGAGALDRLLQRVDAVRRAIVAEP